MSATSVLKKIGIVLATAGEDVTKVLGFPFVSQLLGMIPGRLGAQVQTVAGDLNSFAGIVATAEAMFPAVAGAAPTGSAKIAAATPLIAKELQLWAASNLPGHSKLIVSPEQFQADAAAFGSALVKILNDFGE
jgi:sulfite exporter TauE/SafE